MEIMDMEKRIQMCYYILQLALNSLLCLEDTVCTHGFLTERKL